ncbi:uncharacterized protein K452DRAFT_320717 [Aplosporella prunicola CBS 121167]|uniref:Uncharacterized protein n=1 Tax=Aplosporella prunicola CBS 121167 TaxID=1176127 RepID=A0A6A6B9E6_9PEZI|nr:uncharacterized protein K452DRAFT_320717 [Aplosporella prunicola CBS 121167]KAF2139101.1 hypothetical protein K452DRAFT_320717 [Aplosporella prunicola CBS 121167]
MRGILVTVQRIIGKSSLLDLTRSIPLIYFRRLCINQKSNEDQRNSNRKSNRKINRKINRNRNINSNRKSSSSSRKSNSNPKSSGNPKSSSNRESNSNRKSNSNRESDSNGKSDNSNHGDLSLGTSILRNIILFLRRTKCSAVSTFWSSANQRWRKTRAIVTATGYRFTADDL